MVNVLNVGDIIISHDEPVDVWSVLGSCVAIIFFVKDRVSIICHSQIASQSELDDTCYNQCPNPCFNNLESTHKNKYVKCTLEYMINYIKKMNIDICAMNTTVIGGASLMGRVQNKETVGEKNIKITKQILKAAGIKINRELTGGTHGYTIWYNTKSDELLVKVQEENSTKKELLNNA